MSYFKKQYTRLQDYLLERKISQTSVQRHPMPYADSRSIGILFDASLPPNRIAVTNYAKSLKKKGKKVELLAFYNAKKPEPNFTFRQFTQKDLNFLRRPGGTAIDHFMLNPFDVLINLFLNEEPALEYISALSQAHLRVGPYTERTYCYDLMIDTPDRQDLSRFIEQVETLLNKMNSTPHETTSI